MAHTLRAGVVNFLRLKLGLKPIIDHLQARKLKLGVGALPIRTVLDIGAKVGKMTRQYRKLFPQAQIHAFEPVPACLEKLKSWADTQPDRVHCHPIALGSENRQAEMFWNLDNWGGSSLSTRTIKPHQLDKLVRVPVEIRRLDDIAGSLNLEDDLFVKIDAEGHDMDVIRGGEQTLKRAAAICIELTLPSAGSPEPGFAEFIQALKELGFLYRGNLRSAYRNGYIELVDAIFIHSSRGAARVAAKAG